MTADEQRSILVTGADGFIGRRVVAQLVTGGHRVTAVSTRWRSVDDLRQQVGSGPFSSAVHLAWYATRADYRTNEHENSLSFRAAVEVAELLRQQPEPSHGVFVGSWAELEPRDAYGRWKRRLREELFDRLAAGGLRIAWARLFNVVGPGEAATRLGPSIVTALRDRRAIQMTSGTQVRDFIDVDDVASALAVMAVGQVAGEFDVATGVGTSIAAFARALAAEVGGTDLPQVGALPTPPGEVMRAVGDPSRLLALGWRPRHDLPSIARRIAQQP